MAEAPERTLMGLSAVLQTGVAADLDASMIKSWEQVLTRFSDEVGDRYFLQASLAPVTKLMALA